MPGIQIQITRHTKKKEITTQVENNKSIKTDPELTQMLKLAEKDIKTVVTCLLNIFKKQRHGRYKDPNQIS